MYLLIWSLPTNHTIYSRNDRGQKCEGNCGLCVLNEIIKKKNILKIKKSTEGSRNFGLEKKNVLRDICVSGTLEGSLLSKNPPLASKYINEKSR